MVTTLGREYFDGMYGGSPDPWGFESRWYEERKRALTLAALPQARYERCYEPGCSIGMLTRELAQRCDAVVADDLQAEAVEAAQRRTSDLDHVTVTQRSVPEEWPDGDFDLVVLSELAYYFDDADRARLWRRVEQSVVPQGVLVAVHWRPQVPEYPSNGYVVHAELRARPGWQPLAHYEDDDLLLDVLSWGRSPSVARREGLR